MAVEWQVMETLQVLLERKDKILDIHFFFSNFWSLQYNCEEEGREVRGEAPL